jgi:farnesyl-diphosphate farnesyltransferase
MRAQTENNVDEAIRFTKEILPKVSRTFELAIKFLPGRLGQSVGLAYLLCRIADTYEDSSILSPSQRKDKLLKYSELLATTNGYDEEILSELKNSFVGYRQLSDSAHHMDHLPNLRLVENIDMVLTAVDCLPQNYRRHILPRVQEMAEGMAMYTILASGNESDVYFLRDEDDWDRYCYYVAGTVGHMLTDIFSDYAGFTGNTKERLHILGRSFGLGLQKVNILKDAVVDTKRGICFLPQTFIERYSISFARRSIVGLKGDIAGLIGRVVEICHRHFQDSLEYIKLIPKKHLGLRMFLIIPVMLAAETLKLFTNYPQKLFDKGDLKLARNEVWRLVRRSFYYRFSNRLLFSAFEKTYPN